MDNQNNDRRDYQKEECRDNRAWLIFTGAISLGSVGVAIYCHGQMKKSVKLLNKAADSVAELTVVDVQQGIIDRAINNAANREVGRAVTRAVRMVEDDLTNETQKRCAVLCSRAMVSCKRLLRTPSPRRRRRWTRAPSWRTLRKKRRKCCWSGSTGSWTG